MSTFDLPKIIEALKSSKVKTRSDALRALSDISIGNLKLSNKQLTALAKGILHTLQEERDATNANTLTEERAANASAILLELIRYILANKHQIKPKYKFLCEFGINLTSYYRSLHGDPDCRESLKIIHHCAYSKHLIVQVISYMLSDWSFFTNLLQDFWTLYYNFCVWAIETELKFSNEEDGNRYSKPNEKILSELLLCLLCLICCDLSYKVTCLTQNRTHRVIGNILKDIFQSFKNKENAIHVHIMRIINKLLVLLVVEDIWFLHCLIDTGIRIFLSFATTPTDSLLYQLLLFINLDTLHSYIYLNHLPQSVLSELKGHDSEWSTNYRQLYSLEKLLDMQIRLSLSVKCRLIPADIEVTADAEPKDWLSLQTIRLRSENRFGWLILGGSAKFLLTYYKVSSSEPVSSPFLDDSSLLEVSLSGPQAKRRRTIDKKLDSNKYGSPLRFTRGLIESKDPKEQTCGIQILIFLLHNLHYSEMPKESPSSELTSDSFLKTFQQEIVDLLNVVTGVVLDCTFWALTATRFLVQALAANNSFVKEQFAENLSSIFKMCVSHLKDKESYKPASLLMHYMVEDLGFISTDFKSINNFVDIVMSPAVHGPPKIDYFACLLWRALVSYSLSEGASKRKHLQNSITAWLIQELKSLESSESTPLYVADIFAWLVGEDSELHNYEVCLHSKSTENFLDMKRTQNIERLLVLESLVRSYGCGSRTLFFPKFAQVTTNVKNALLVFTEMFKFDDNNGASANDFVSSALVFARVSHVASAKFPSDTQNLEVKATDLMLSLARAIILKDDVSEILSTLLLFQAENETLLKFGFPFEVFEYRFQTDYSPTFMLQSNRLDHLDDEFLQKETSPIGDRNQQEAERASEQTRFLQYLIFCKCATSEQIFLYILALLPKSIISCVKFCLGHIKEGLVGKTKEDLVKLTRLMGEKLLSTGEYAKEFEALLLCCEMLEELLAIEFAQLPDYVDIFKYLMTLLENRLILDDECNSRMIFLKILTTNRNLSNLDLAFSQINPFMHTSNGLKLSLSHRILNSSILRPSPGLNFEHLCSFLCLNLNTSSIEEAVVGCYILCELVKVQKSSTLQVVLALTEFSRAKYLIDYIRVLIENVCKLQLETPRSFLNSSTYPILQLWLKADGCFQTFPFKLFQYSTFHDFVCDYYQAMVSLWIAMNPDSERHTSIGVMRLCEESQLPERDVLKKSIPQAVALAYTSGGVKDEVMTFYENRLSKEFDENFKSLLPLIILEFLHFTDYSDEHALKVAAQRSPNCDLFNSARIHKHQLSILIPPKLTYTVVLTLIERFFAIKSSHFFSSQMSSFLLRRLLLLYKNDPCHRIRMVKFFVCIASFNFESNIVSALLLQACINCLEPETFQDISTIFDHVEFKSLLNVTFETFNSTLLRLFSTYIRLQLNGTSYNAILSKLERFLDVSAKDSGIPEVVVLLYIKMAKSLRGVSQTFTIVEIENYLEQEAMKQIIKNSELDMIIIISELFPLISDLSDSCGSHQLTSLLLNHQLSLKPNFQKQVAEYFANQYILGISIEGLKFYASIEESNTSLNSTNRINLDFVITFLKRTSELKDQETIAFSEAAIGVLLNILGNRPQAFSEFPILVFPSKDTLLRPYPIGLQIFSMLYPEVLNKSSLDLTSIVTLDLTGEGQFGKWVCNLYLSIVGELTMDEDLKGILRCFPFYLDSRISSLIPDLICFVVSKTEEKGASFVQLLIEGFLSDQTSPRCFEMVCLIKDLVLTLRNRALDGSKKFQNLYKSLDLLRLFLAFKDTSLSKVSLLLFEDHAKKDPQKCMKAFEQPLFQVYESLDEFDLLVGLPEKCTIKSSIDLLKQAASSSDRLKYESAILDSSMLFKQPINSDEISLALLDEGFTGVPVLFDEDIFQIRSFEWAWKLDKWEAPYKETSLTMHDAIYKYLYQLKHAQSEIESTYDSIMSDLILNGRNWNHSSFKTRFENIRDYFETLGTIFTVHGISKVPPDSFGENSTKFEVDTIWLERPDSLFNFEILLARRAAFQIHMAINFKVEKAYDSAAQAAISELLRYNALSRRRNLTQKTFTSALLLEEFLSLAKINCPTLREQLERRSNFLVAKALWVQGNNATSIAMLDELSNSTSTKVSCNELFIDRMLIEAYKIKWKSEARFEVGSNLLKHSIEPMIPLLESIRDTRQREEVYSILAVFCENQANSNQVLVKIEDLKRRIACRKKEAEEIKDHYSKTSVTSVEKKEVQRYYSRLKTQISAQNTELDLLIENRRKLQSYSVQFYLKSVLIQDNEETVDKLFSLILEQASDLELQKSIEVDLHNLPSFIGVGWVTQLLSRVSTELSTFQSSIQNIITRVCTDHPFHSLYNLISLEYHGAITSPKESTAIVLKVLAAKEIHKKLNLLDAKFVNKILKPIEQFCEESVLLAEHKVTKNRFIQLDKLKMGFYWIESLPKIPPPTVDLHISHEGYDNVPVMQLISPKVAIAASGLSLPKIATFTLSTGETHKMLFKNSADDLRQDAIMEQVFEKVNHLMLREPEARKRELKIRVYRAVPLGPKAGVIEFVPNTNALIEIIRPHHLKQDELKLEVARDMMKKVQNEDISVRVKVYEDITKKVKPVLHNFFVDKFRRPETWFSSRLAYTRGIATTSIVGHILGLGDRHCNNILIDGSTGEPVHIDLGVAFDQGRRLPIPESVPFRLTRDIVDGFGILGTRGLFNQACEHTFRVLRSNEGRITSILDVLRWDPLYSWSISPIRMKRLQETAERGFELQPAEDGSEATTAILTVTDKISAGGLSSSAAVRELIREATDVKNLAIIYCGWCPFY